MHEYSLNPLMRNNWRASLVPAAALIPAPIAYIKVVSVKKLVVGFWNGPVGLPQSELLTGNECMCLLLSVRRIYDVYLKKIRVFKAGYCLNT